MLQSSPVNIYLIYTLTMIGSIVIIAPGRSYFFQLHISLLIFPPLKVGAIYQKI